ncbi:MAG: DNA-directed RNA polymerase subunit beta' [Mycoplasma sp.]
MAIKINSIEALKIGIASPDRVREWSHGEVTKSETINYKTLKPEKGGLFDEVIFGPIKDYECSCGKYKKVKYRGKICEKCGVEITESIVRRERMGHIELATPIAHSWMIKELPNPSKISLLLNISYKEVEQVVYFVNYIILSANGCKEFRDKEVIDLNNSKTSKNSRGKLRSILSEIMKKLEKGSIDMIRAQNYFARLKDSSLPFSIEEVFNFITKHTGVRFGIGAEAIYQLLKELDLNQEVKKIEDGLKKSDPHTPEFRKLTRRLETVKWFIESNNKPEWMVLTVIPVTPPDTRPIVQLDGGKFTTSDINNFYRKIIIRNERLKHLMSLNAPTIILNNEKRMLQESVDALIDNASRSKPIVSKDRHPLKSLTDHLKGKQGLFRQNLLGKRVDYSGRSVIVVGPDLNLDQAGIPAQMVLKLFKPFIVHELMRKVDDYGNEMKPIAANVKIAEQMILKEDDEIWPIVEKVIKTRPVLLNRAPTLHRLGIQAFEPKLVDGKAIRLHALACTAFNADFDGDQMAVHLPITDAAVAEARNELLAANHILGPKDGKPIITPTQDMVIGLYHVSTEAKDLKGETTVFSSPNQAIKYYEMGSVALHALVGIPTTAYPKKQFPKAGLILTTVGKIIMNEAFPEDFVYINNTSCKLTDTDIIPFGTNFQEAVKNHEPQKSLAKKTISNIIMLLYKQYSVNQIAKTMDLVKNLGFKYSTKSGVTMSVFDLPKYDKKYEYFAEADEKINKFTKQYKKGLLTDDERYVKVINLWSGVKDKVTSDVEKIMNDPANKNNSVIIMVNSGARGNVSQFTQLLGMRGLMNRSYNYERKSDSFVIRDTIEVPIKDSFLDGLTIHEYYNSSYGARKGMADTAMKTSKSGYMTRKLVDAAQEVIVTEEDCGTTRGIEVSAIIDTNENNVIETLAERIANRYSMEDIFIPDTTTKLVGKNEIITPEIAAEIERVGITKVTVRSVLHCKAKNGICQHCFGNDLTTNKPIEIGSAIGVVAAQSIGEPGTQLNLRTFHTGGASGSEGGNIAQGFERLKQLFDMIPPKSFEQAIISEINGTVKSISLSDTGYVVEIVNEELDESITYNAPFNAVFRAKVNDVVKIGDKITEGSIDINKLSRICGVKAARDYLLKEVQKVYRLQGIEISDKYIEIIIRQMTNKMKVLNPGDSQYFIGQIISINDYIAVNKELLLQNQAPITASNLIFGLDEIPSHSESFLSAASFQDTKKVLTDAAIRSQSDYLLGLKENVMLGRLIPAGTGLKK